MLSDSERKRFDAITGDLGLDSCTSRFQRRADRKAKRGSSNGQMWARLIAWAEGRSDARFRHIRGT